MDFQGRETFLYNFLLLQQGAGVGGIDGRARERRDAGEHIPTPAAVLDSLPQKKKSLSYYCS